VLADADVDALPSDGIAAMGGDHIGTRFQKRPRLIIHRDRCIDVIVAARRGRQDAVDVDLGILIVLEQDIELDRYHRRQRDGPPDPDVGRGPLGAHAAHAMAEWGRRRLPAGVIEPRAVPAVRRLLDGKAPGDGFVFGGRHQVGRHRIGRQGKEVPGIGGGDDRCDRLDDLAIIGDQAIELLLDIGDLGIDVGADSDFLLELVGGHHQLLVLAGHASSHP
jgi:hypothetical protein